MSRQRSATRRDVHAARRPGVVLPQSGEQPEPEQPFCLVAAVDEPLRDRLTDLIDEHGLRAAAFADVAALLAAAAEHKPELVVFDVGFEFEPTWTRAMKGMAALPKKPGGAAHQRVPRSRPTSSFAPSGRPSSRATMPA